LQNIKTKLLKIYIPFLIVAIGSIMFYYGFRWLFDIKLGILPLKEDVLNIWIPIVLPWIPIYFWLRRRIRIVNLRGKNGDGYFFVQLLMCMVIVIPMVISQKYLEKSAYSLHEIETSFELKELQNEKYFKINQFDITATLHHFYVSRRTSGRHNEHLDVSIYIACPFNSSTYAWYGIQYDIQLRNKDSKTRKQQAFQQFLRASKRDFESYDFKDVSYFEKLGYSDDRDGFIRAIERNIPNLDGNEEIILIPKKKPFEKRYENTLAAFFGIFGVGSLIVLLFVSIPKIDKRELANFKKNKPLKDDELKDMLSYLNPLGEHKTTAILLLSNILIFIVMIFKGISIISPTAIELLEFGGNRRTEIEIHGEIWRLFTSTFIHAGFMHLGLNLFGIVLYTNFLEKILTPIKLMLAYIVCGCIASVASVIFHENTVSIGASGAIFGLSGIILAFMIFKVYPTYMRGMIWTMLLLFGGLNLLIGFITSVLFRKEELTQKASKEYP